MTLDALERGGVQARAVRALRAASTRWTSGGRYGAPPAAGYSADLVEQLDRVEGELAREDPGGRGT